MSSEVNGVVLDDTPVLEHADSDVSGGYAGGFSEIRDSLEARSRAAIERNGPASMGRRGHVTVGGLMNVCAKCQ